MTGKNAAVRARDLLAVPVLDMPHDDESLTEIILEYREAMRELLADLETERERIRQLASVKGAVYRTGSRTQRHFAPFADLLADSAAEASEVRGHEPVPPEVQP